VARPLREQFAIATFVLLAPVAAVMTFAATAVYRGQMDQLRAEASAFAQIIAAHIEAVGPAADRDLQGFLKQLQMPSGSNVIVADETGRKIAEHEFFAPGEQPQQVERTPMPAAVRGRPLTVSVGIPTPEAWRRATPNTQRTILISGMATLILLLMQVVFLRRWLPALASLERSAAKVGAGDLSPPTSAKMPSLELEHLRDSFHDMVNRLRAAREAIALQVEEERAMRLELESLQQQVIRQERLAAIGVLVSGIAHELNNPLQTISGFSELLQHDDRIDSGTRSDLALIHQESARASAIIRNLARFGRQKESTPTPVSLAEVVSSVIELRQRRLHEQGIDLERDERATRPAHAVFTELQQVVLNFVINAEQSVRASSSSSRRIILRTYEEDGLVHLEVEDTGPGVAPENETKLFQPFFTTKPVGEGTGLGLSVSYGIIHSLGGEIGYRRGDLGGAVFYFSVPVSDREDVKEVDVKEVKDVKSATAS
jgi:C4-dicarboxylate-specific signal transduction histidine kinase